MNEAALTLLTLAGVVVLFVSNRVPVEIVAVGSALVLYGLGIISLTEALAGFADPAVLLIGALFVVSEGLDSTGVTTWVGQAVVSRAGTGVRRLLLYTMLLSAGLTALIGLNGAVAALLPMTIVMAMRRSLQPSRLLMPLAFAGSAGWPAAAHRQSGQRGDLRCRRRPRASGRSGSRSSRSPASRW